MIKTFLVCFLTTGYLLGFLRPDEMMEEDAENLETKQQKKESEKISLESALFPNFNRHKAQSQKKDIVSQHVLEQQKKYDKRTKNIDMQTIDTKRTNPEDLKKTKDKEILSIQGIYIESASQWTVWINAQSVSSQNPYYKGGLVSNVRSDCADIQTNNETKTYFVNTEKID